MHALALDGSAWTNLLAPVLMVTGAVGMGVLLTLSVRGRIARRNADRPSPRQLVEQTRALVARPDRDHADVATSELVETSRRLAAQLDNKAARLEALIRQADERIARLGGATSPPTAASAAPASAPPPAPTEPPPPSPREPARVEDPLVQAVYDLADQGRSALEIAQRLDEQVGKIELILALRAA